MSFDYEPHDGNKYRILVVIFVNHAGSVACVAATCIHNYTYIIVRISKTGSWLQFQYKVATNLIIILIMVCNS